MLLPLPSRTIEAIADVSGGGIVGVAIVRFRSRTAAIPTVIVIQ